MCLRPSTPAPRASPKSQCSGRIQANRCIVPASGYFEWKTMPDGEQPYFISAADGGVLGIARQGDR
jgi:putative SOS response-associated peptidase YedK